MFLNLAKVIGIIKERFVDTVIRIVPKGLIALAHFYFLFFVLPRNGKPHARLGRVQPSCENLVSADFTKLQRSRSLASLSAYIFC